MPPPRPAHRGGDTSAPLGGVAIARPRRSTLDITSFLKSFYESRATSLPSGVGCCESFIDPDADHCPLGWIAAGGERGPRPHRSRAGSALLGGANSRRRALAPMRLPSRATSLPVNMGQFYPPPLLGPAVSFPHRNAYRCYEPTAVVACGERGLPLSGSESGPSTLPGASNAMLPPSGHAAANATEERAWQRANSLTVCATREEAPPPPATLFPTPREEAAAAAVVAKREEAAPPPAIPFPAPPPLRSPLHRVRRGASGRLLLLAPPGAAPPLAAAAERERRDAAEATHRDAAEACRAGRQHPAPARSEAPSVAAAVGAAAEDSCSEISSWCESSVNADHETNRNTKFSFCKSKTAGEGGPRAGAAAAVIMAARVVAAAAAKRRQGEEEPTAVERIVAEMQAAAAEEERVAARAKATHGRVHEGKEEAPRATEKTEAQDLAVVPVDNPGEQCPPEQGPPYPSTENTSDQEPRSNVPRADPSKEGVEATAQSADTHEVAPPSKELLDASPAARPPAHRVSAALPHAEGPSMATDGPGAALPALIPLPTSIHRVRRGADGRLHFVALPGVVCIAAPAPLAWTTAPDAAVDSRAARRCWDSASAEEPVVVADSVDVAADYHSSADPGTVPWARGPQPGFPLLRGTAQDTSPLRPDVTSGAVESSRVAPEQRQLGSTSPGLTVNCIGSPYVVCTVSGQRQLQPMYSWDVANDCAGGLYVDGAPCVVAE